MATITHSPYAFHLSDFYLLQNATSIVSNGYIVEAWGYASKNLPLLGCFSLVLFFLLLEYSRYLSVSKRQPHNLPIVGGSTAVGQWISRIVFSFDARRVLSRSYSQSNGKPWAVPMHDKYLICLPTNPLIGEYSSASSKAISVIESVHQIFPPEELYGGQPYGDTRGNLGFSRLLSSDLRSNLTKLKPLIRRRVVEILDNELSPQNTSKEWKDIYLQSLAYTTNAKVNCVAFFGDAIASNPEFITALLRYVRNATIASELMRLLPGSIKSWVGRKIVDQGNCRRTVLDFLKDEINQRREVIENSDKQLPENDLIGWAVMRGRKAPVEGLAIHVLAMFFAAAHQPSMLLAFAIWRLQAHPEYTEALRAEAMYHKNEAYEVTDNHMPLLDSFLKEVARLHPITSVTLPHQTTKHFTFSDGSHVPEKNWITIPTSAIMQDSAIYTDPTEFQAFRFVDFGSGNAPPVPYSSFVEATSKFPFWGNTTFPCPGRFYASMTIKMILAHLLLEYDFHTTSRYSTPDFNWGISTVPHPSIKIRARRRT